jgi:hypothetical protein
MHSHRIERNCLIVKLSENTDDLSFVETLYNGNVKHLILDLHDIMELNSTDLLKFTTFGKNIVKNNSFVMISNLPPQEEYMVVPSIQEALDIIEMEDIERQLNI